MNNQRKFISSLLQFYRKSVLDSSSKYFYSGSGKIGEQQFEKVIPKPSKLCSSSGQPTAITHPHLIKKGEITSGISKEEYIGRQFGLMNLLNKNSKSKDQVVILIGNPRRYMIDKIPYLFRQDTDFLYMSGCLEADCLLVMHSCSNSTSSHYKTVMFTHPYDPSKELWDGPSTNPVSAPAVWNVDEGLPLSDIQSYLSSITKELGHPTIWFHSDNQVNQDIYQSVNSWIVERKKKLAIQSPKIFIQYLRSIKSEAEIELMRRTCQISAESIMATMSSCRSPVSEAELFATVDYHCRMKGADHLAYPPVVAGGPRSNIIHYINNNNIIKPGEMVLMDAGSEYRGYSGDITRTWPVNGKFSSAQRDLYEAVLEVQNYVINACVEMLSMNQLFSLMCSKLGSVLQELSIIPRDLPPNQLSRAAYGFCPHHVSHYLGMDVHDCSLLSKNVALQPGTIITVEPGVYISEKNSAVDKRYLGLGIRIEDDILIGDRGQVEILSARCPRHPDELEALVGSAIK